MQSVYIYDFHIYVYEIYIHTHTHKTFLNRKCLRLKETFTVFAVIP
jgi:hypothetical protein